MIGNQTFINQGFDTTKMPPTVLTDGKVIDGNTRVEALRNIEQGYICMGGNAPLFYGILGLTLVLKYALVESCYIVPDRMFSRHLLPSRR